MNSFEPEFQNDTFTQKYTISEIEDAIKNERILRSRVSRCNYRNTLILDIGNEIFGEIDFVELEYHKDNSLPRLAAATGRMGKIVSYVPTRIEKDENNKYKVICSRKKAQLLCLENYISKLRPGDIIDAQKIATDIYGVFVDIGCGIVALLKTRDISATHS